MLICSKGHLALSLLVDDLQQSRAGVFDDDLKHLEKDGQMSEALGRDHSLEVRTIFMERSHVLNKIHKPNLVQF